MTRAFSFHGDPSLTGRHPVLEHTYASDFEIHAKEMLLVKQKVNEILSKHTGKTLRKVEQDTDRDNFLNATEAVTYGIIDEILEKRPETNGK